MTATTQTPIRSGMSPRLLSINSYHYHRGGADNVYFQHAELMQRHGWENAFFSMHHPRNLPSDWSAYFVDEIEFGHAYPLAQKVSKAIKVVYSVEAQRKLRALLAAWRPDVAHLHNIYHHLSPSILPVLRKAGVPAVMTAHDLKIACPNNKMYNETGVCERCKGGQYAQLIAHRCIKDSLAASTVVALEAVVHRLLGSYGDNLERIIVPSRFFLSKFVEWGWPAERFAYIPNWIDADAIQTDDRAGDYFLYLGRLAPEKGIETLVRACVLAGVKLAVAGDGPLMSGLQAMLRDGAGNVRLFGHCEGDQLATLVRGARAVVVPSQWYENAPLSVLESFAAAKPVIGSRIGGIPELIDEGRTGWLVEPGDVAALVSVLLMVNALPDASVRAMGRAARARVERDFHRRGYLASMLALYDAIGVRCASAGASSCEASGFPDLGRVQPQ